MRFEQRRKRYMKDCVFFFFAKKIGENVSSK